MAPPPPRALLGALFVTLALAPSCWRRRHGARRRHHPDVPPAAAVTAPSPSPWYDASVEAPDAADAADVPEDHGTRSSLVIVPHPGRACVDDHDCGGGHCYNDNLVAQYSRVFRDCDDAQAWREAQRPGTCVQPACATDLDCPRRQRCGRLEMVPFPQKVCLPADCVNDLECYAGGGRIGRCVPYLAGRPCEHGGWHCSYPDDPCSPAEVMRRCRPLDGAIAYCIPVAGRFRCVAESPPAE